MGFINRVEEALAAGRKAVELEERNRVQDGPGLAIVAIAAVWQSTPDKKHLVHLGQKSRVARRILITSSTNLELFQLEGIVTEYVPIRPEMGDAEKIYCARKVTVLRQKWKLDKFIAADPASDSAMRELGIAF